MSWFSNIGLYICTFIILCLHGIVSTQHDGGTIKHPATDFAHHMIITPKIFHGRTKREVKSTHKIVDGGHIQDVMIHYDANGTRYVLDIHLNNELVSDGFSIYYKENGRDVVEQPRSNSELCQYQGDVRGKQDSWVAISTCYGLSGVVFDGEELFYLEPGSGENHFLYRHSDIKTNRTCGTLERPHHIFKNIEASESLRDKRSSAVVRGPYNANDNSRFVELELVVDHQIYMTMGRSIDKVHHHCKELINIVNRLFQSLNIFIVLIGIVIWKERDEIQISHDSLVTLNNFVSYREKRLMDGFLSDNGQLLTLVQFANNTVGKAFIQTICQLEKSSGINVEFSPLPGLVAQTMVHEMGHNFGMDHDKEHCNCVGCLMSPSSANMIQTEWSYCSKNYLADTYEKGKDFCLKNKPIRMLDSPVCGNGFVEAGEQCDCGLKDVCDNPCCDASTCLLQPSASCGTGKCCDLQTCRVKRPGTLCRPTNHPECDLPEFCTGDGEYCPDDVYKMDGLACEDGNAFCYGGRCPSHTAQCQLLWGPTSRSAELCYKSNNEGNNYRNCGFDKRSKQPIKCGKKDVKCGRLQCERTSQTLLADSGAHTQRWYTLHDGRSIDCRAVAGSPGLELLDIGLVPSGAKCGDDKMCVNQTCVPVSTLQRHTCPTDCNGNGVCNSNGNCHCDSGFAPPLCKTPGPGGSLDSGAVKDLRGYEYFSIALYVVFLGIVPLIFLVLMIVYCNRHRHISSLSKMPSKSPHLCNNAWDCCCGSLCNQLHTYMLCGTFGNDHPNDDSGKDLSKSRSYAAQMPRKSGSGNFSANAGNAPPLRTQQGTGTAPRIQANTSRMSFNERLKRFNSIKKWTTGVVEISVINLPGLDAQQHKPLSSGSSKANNAPELDVEFHPKANSSKSNHVQSKKNFFESKDLQSETTSEGLKRKSSEHTLSKNKLSRKNSKGLQLNVAVAKINSAKMKILKSGDSDLSTPETPPVEKYLRSIRGVTNQPLKKDGRGLSNPGYAKTPPPPPPAAFKPRL